jgi:predicted dehydrogenase
MTKSYIFGLIMNSKLRFGMIGGGPGAFIGAVHRMAARIDGEAELVSGVFSSDHEKSKQTGVENNLLPGRVYKDFREMIFSEAKLAADERMHFVSIVTPNHLHYEPAKLALENGFHVVLDKPISFNVDEAMELKSLVDTTGNLFCLTHTYTGYPMIKEAREQVRSGKFGKIRKVFVEYPQGWLSEYLEGSHQKQAEWRTDPAKTGIAGAMGDIGSHAFNIAEYVSDLKIIAVCAQINTVVEGRKVDDDGSVLLKFENEASGVIMVTQVAAGEENNLKIRVYGEKGGLEWQHEDPNSLIIKWLDRPTEIYRAGENYLSSIAIENCRVPPGHPEGYIEAFANHYRNFCKTLKAALDKKQIKPEWEFPGVNDGLRGMIFVEKVIESGHSEKKWIGL